MRSTLLTFALLGIQCVAFSAPQSPAPINPQVLGQLREEGLTRSQVLALLGYQAAMDEVTLPRKASPPPAKGKR